MHSQEVADILTLTFENHSLNQLQDPGNHLPWLPDVNPTDESILQSHGIS